MLDYKKIFSIKPFSLKKKDKNKWYFAIQKKLTAHHFKNCEEYKKITNKIHGGLNRSRKLSELPFVPAYLFKDYNLITKSNTNLSKILTSSGTSGSKNSKVNLDRKTALLQSRALSNIFQDILNRKRGTMFVVDSPKVLSGLQSMNARGAAIRGFSQLVDRTIFLLDENLNLNADVLKNFVKNNPNDQFIIFGFTSFIWQYLIKKINNKKIISSNNGILIHGGGWKKMQDQAVNRDFFNKKITDTIGINKIHNYYGMVEQTGSVFLECEFGFFHTSIFSDVIIRDANLKISPIKKDGLLQVFSLLPLSYPGHNILTEDIGSLQGEDNCKCGRKGKYFSIKGRVKGTEIRGCSDTH
jgi:phenylacetate-coenzyme A ligase PaaK-like adenylate-forming protein